MSTSITSIALTGPDTAAQHRRCDEPSSFNSRAGTAADSVTCSPANSDNLAPSLYTTPAICMHTPWQSTSAPTPHHCMPGSLATTASVMTAKQLTSTASNVAPSQKEPEVSTPLPAQVQRADSGLSLSPNQNSLLVALEVGKVVDLRDPLRARDEVENMSLEDVKRVALVLRDMLAEDPRTRKSVDLFLRDSKTAFGPSDRSLSHTLASASVTGNGLVLEEYATPAEIYSASHPYFRNQISTSTHGKSPLSREDGVISSLVQSPESAVHSAETSKVGEDLESSQLEMHEKEDHCERRDARMPSMGEFPQSSLPLDHTAQSMSVLSALETARNPEEENDFSSSLASCQLAVDPLNINDKSNATAMQLQTNTSYDGDVGKRDSSPEKISFINRIGIGDSLSDLLLDMGDGRGAQRASSEIRRLRQHVAELQQALKDRDALLAEISVRT